MKKASALAVIDYEDGTVTRGRYLVLFGGSTASTAESLGEALATTRAAVIDHAFLPDIHPLLYDAVFGTRRRSSGALLILETDTASSIVRAVEAAMKGTPVDLVEVRLSDTGLAGKGIALLAGTLHDVDAAAALAAAGTSSEAPPRGFSHRIIAAPHDVLERDITATTRFDAAPLLELDGEAG